MDKSADTRFDILDPIAERWSPRAFTDQPVEPEKLGRLFEAARWSASSYNEQPWRFIVTTRDDPDAHARAVDCLVEKNAAWAQHAPVLFFTVAARKFSRNGKPNRVAEHDVGLAMGNLSIQATAEGLVVHQMAGIEIPKVRVAFNIPDGFDPVAACAVGYQGEPEDLPEEWMREAEGEKRSRKPLSEIVFGADWETPFTPIQS
ncbi:MAG: nitroreductase family protein [Phycisphaeraceae bacterium]|nr:nitroreductase family protein [Phycisphaeraceae bacterium]